MNNFNETQKAIKREINAYLDFKVKFKLTVDQHDQKFWRNRMLVPIDIWDNLHKKSDPMHILKYMPEKFVINPLQFRSRKHPEDYAKYMAWIVDYLFYLKDICKMPEKEFYEKFIR